MGWVSLLVRWSVYMARFWNRLINMENTRLICSIDSIYERLVKQIASYWHDQIQYKPNLRTCITFKINFVTEPYVHQSLSKSRRSLMTQLRLGILLLEIETGRFTPIYDKTIKKNRKRLPSEWLCKLCESYIFIRIWYSDLTLDNYINIQMWLFRKRCSVLCVL